MLGLRFLVGLVISISPLVSLIIIAVSPFLVLASASNPILLVLGLFWTEDFFPSNLLRNSLIELSQVFHEGLIDALIELPIFLKSHGYCSQNTLV